MADVMEQNQALSREIGKANKEINRLLDLLKNNESSAQFRERKAFEAGTFYTNWAEVHGMEDAFQNWRYQVLAEGIKASMDAGREP